MTVRFFTYPVIVLLIWLGSGCAASAPLTTIVCGTCEEHTRFVRLQSAKHSSSTDTPEPFSHPLTISPEQWKLIVSQVRVKPEIHFFKKGVEEAAFDRGEIDYLSMTLSRAFEKASPNQWVAFGLSTPTRAGGHYMTTGVWYARGSELHLLLPNVQAPVRMENLRQVLDKDPMFNVLEGTQYEFLPSKFTTIHKDESDQSMLSHFTQVTPHLVLDYQRLLASASDSKNVHSEGYHGTEIP